MYTHTHTYTSIHTNTLSVYVFTIWFFFHMPHFGSLWNFPAVAAELRSVSWRKEWSLHFRIPHALVQSSSLCCCTSSTADISVPMSSSLHASFTDKKGFMRGNQQVLPNTDFPQLKQFGLLWIFVCLFCCLVVLIYDGSDMTLLQWKRVKLQTLTHDLFPG